MVLQELSALRIRGRHFAQFNPALHHIVAGDDEEDDLMALYATANVMTHNMKPPQIKST